MRAMRRTLLAAIVLTLGTSGGAALGGCGSSTSTVSVAEAPTSPRTSASTSTTAPASTAPAQTARSQAPASGGTPAPTGTRSAPEPAFVQPGASAEGLSGATAVLRARGFTAGSAADYHPGQTLRVLLGTRAGSGDGHGQQAFFFVNGRYIGTDSSVPSATVRVLGQSDTEVTLAYPLYRTGDPLCCPSAGQATVRFQLDNGRLIPLDPIPSASPQSGLSRR
jgi:hypothetical protein